MIPSFAARPARSTIRLNPGALSGAPRSDTNTNALREASRWCLRNALVLCIGPDQRQAKITRDYIEAVFNASPILSRLVVSRTADAIELENRISIEVRAASFRRLRGITAVTVIATEAAFWYSDETSANADTEILNAVRPSLATTRGQLIVISLPYGKRGEVWNAYRRHYGPDGRRHPQVKFWPSLM